MWAVGCIALELISNTEYFVSNNDNDLMKEHIEKLGTDGFHNIYYNINDHK